ncbi:MAG: heme lyase CcmF/NrfE family subunit [Alphaproteobacteria bacterium]
MIAEFGHFALILALMVALLQGLSPLLTRFVTPAAIRLVKPAAAIQFLLISTAFLALIACYIASDFSVLNVVQNSHSAKPLIYKITGAWGNHEGSMLLWVFVLSLFGFLVAWLKAEDTELKFLTLSISGLIAVGFLVFILLTSNPFWRVFPPAAEGEDLNPLLQDIGLAFHPPTLYVGYVGYGIVFAYAIAGLIRGRIDEAWARAVKPWLGITWSALTFGIAAGSWWAYRELGWGGWWFWDPVENVSLLPWLVGGALLHSNLVLEKRGSLGRWVVLLAILTFSLSLMGTFIVRSGLITSVHAFASDPMRGLFILAYLGVVTGGALALYALRSLPSAAPVKLLSRSGFILLNNLLLLTAAGTILLATLYPIILELLGLPAVSVGAPYFNITFLPLTAPLLILAAFAPLLAWDGATRPQLLALVKATILPVLAASFLVLLLVDHDVGLFVIGASLSALLTAGIIRYLTKILRSGGLRLPHLASAVGHTGLALLALAITATSLGRETYEKPVVDNAPFNFGDYQLEMVRAEKKPGVNYETRMATFRLTRDDKFITELTPEIRTYPVRGMTTSEAAIYSRPWRDIYLVMGESTLGGKATANIGVRMYVTPFQQILWLGFVLIGASGALSFLGALKRKKS